MAKVHDSIAWYQQKIGSYDKQLWEQSVEQKVLKGIQQAPGRVVRPKTELIDVDLVRGSTFTKAKPQVPWTYITINTFSRVVLFPFHYKWWIQQTSLVFWIFLMVLYSSQIATIVVFFNNVGGELAPDANPPPNTELQEQSLTEVMIPFLLMVLLGLIHSQTVLTHLKPPVSKSHSREGWRCKRSLSHFSNVDVVGTSTFPSADVASPSQSRSSIKGHPGSRPLSVRTKERRVRMKSNSQRPSLRRENLERGSQDSESAYNTHEASDSILDRNSSMEHDSNISDHKGSNSSGCENRGRHHMDNNVKMNHAELHGQKDINFSESRDSILTLSNTSPYCLNKDATSDSKVDIKPKKSGWFSNSRTRTASADSITRESQESDLPNETNSEDERVLKKHTRKLSIQSVSSDIDEDDDCEAIITYISQGKVMTDENTDKSKNLIKLCQTREVEVGVPKTSEFKGKIDFKLREDIHSDISNASIENDNALTAKHTLHKTVLHDCIAKKTCDGISSHCCDTHCSCQSKSSVKTIEPKSDVKRSVHGNSLVHFTKDLVQLREITPKSSREGTPTHSQSDNLLQTKRSLRECNFDSDSDSDKKSSNKILRSMLRRKSCLQETTSELSGSGLRNRRVHGESVIRDTKNAVAISSSEGEEGGHSSACSRESRASKKIFQNMASSEEWGDHLQSDVDYSSESSGSEPHISGQGESDQESDSEWTGVPPGQPIVIAPGQPIGMTPSNLHAINLLTTSSTASHPPDKVTCIIWERNECKKVELTALDIGWAIIETVDKIPESSDYIFIGLSFSVVMALIPFLFEAFHSKEFPSVLSWDILYVLWEWSTNNPWRHMLIHINAAMQRFCLSAIFFFLLSVADRTFKQRLLYAKHFCYLTSSRRARKFDLPHLRLNKVRNIRAWLSLRSYLKKRGPQRSVDVIVSSAFLLTLSMLILMCLQLLRDAETYLNYLVNWELLVWCMALGIYLLRFMTLGLRINKKYRNLSVLITEQINLYLQMEQKPHKKEELMVANNVLKLAECLLKELESPFKISGISANPLILNVTKVVVLSAFSAVLTELLGFKLKLYKIKLRA